MKVNFITAYGLMWKRCFDFKGTSGRKEFWLPFIWQTILSIISIPLIGVNVFMGLFLHRVQWIAIIPLAIIMLYLVITILPFSALTIRRLRDAGKSGWWYMLIFLVGIGNILLLVLCSAGSSVFMPSQNEPMEIYGPPVDWNEVFNPEQNEPSVVYGPPIDYDFEPSENEPAEIYGPPQGFVDDEEEDESFDVIDNEMVCLYGPPEMFDDGE